MLRNISIPVCRNVDISAISCIFDNNGYIYFDGYISMKYLFLTILVVSGSAPYVWAAQLDATILSQDNTTEPSFQFLRIIYLEYTNGGDLAELLQGKTQTISFSADSATLGMDELVDQINKNLEAIPSNAFVTGANLDYQATLRGNEKSAVIEYKIHLTPTITNHIVEHQSDKSTIDANWRGINLGAPVMLDTKFGQFDINDPQSALNVMIPEVMEKIKDKDVVILHLPLMNAKGMLDLPLDKWHSLFDNTAIIPGSKEYNFTGKNVVTRYSMGECSLEVGMCNDREWIANFDLDKPYTIKIVESRDDATIAIDGYVTSSMLDGIEVFETSLKSAISAEPSTNEFPATVMYGMAIFAVIGGIIMFVISGRKVRKDQNQGQTGIDPKHLKSYETSDSAGGYKTNRDESYLASHETSRMPV
jgi:hypothetical protein